MRLDDVLGVGFKGADALEKVLFSAAATHASGFSSINKMWLTLGKRAAITGAGVALLFAIKLLFKKEPAQQQSQEQPQMAGPVASTVTVFIAAAMCAFVVQQMLVHDKALRVFTGKGTINTRAAYIVGCVAIPAALTRLQYGTAVPGTIVGALLYALFGCIPVAINDSIREKELVKVIKKLFEDCYPWNAAAPCSDAHGSFVQMWPQLIPDSVDALFHLRSKDTMLQLLNVLDKKQLVDMTGALLNTPLGMLFGYLVGK